MGHLTTHREQIPLRVFQLDDGYQMEWGDWKPKPSFPEDMSEIRKKIDEAGFIPGIWLAPFSADLNAELVREHPVRFLDCTPPPTCSLTVLEEGRDRDGEVRFNP